ncbi:MAG: oligopeptide/dipeptide ABC transporter ATP-binding protein, partial [Ilumatobacteraceae bacterium]
MTVEEIAEIPIGDASAHALSVEDLELAYLVRGIPREVLRGVTFYVRPGEAYGLVGESGCGKSTTAYAALRYLPSNGRITGGRILVDGDDVTKMSDRELRQFRASEASMVYQDPGSALNPTLKVGRQVAEAFTILGVDKRQAQQDAEAALRKVRIADPSRLRDRYPHQLSGGMQQRVVIAMALAGDPKLLVLDEPTTGLDATVEAEVLDLVRALRHETDAAILLIAHNLGVIRSMCDRVGVMYAGKIVEEGDAAEVFEAPKHPYTIGLLQCLPRHGVRKSEQALFTIPGTLPQIGTPLPTCVYVDRCALADDLCRTEVPPVVHLDVGHEAARTDAPHYTRCHHVELLDRMPEPEKDVGEDRLEGKVVMEMRDVSKTFRQRGNDVLALVGIQLDLGGGETLGLVGESGSGKTTLAKAMLGIY